VIAHEIAHVKHKDTRTLRLAATFNAVVAGMSRAGGFMLLLTLPLLLLGQATFPLSGVLLLMVAPLLGQSLQLALSRAREYAADDTAVTLTEDPRGLASALVRLESSQRGLLGRLFGLGAPMVPEWLRTHPATESRVRRLVGDRAPAPPPPPRVDPIFTPPRPSPFGPAGRPRRGSVRIVLTRGPRGWHLRHVV